MHENSILAYSYPGETEFMLATIKEITALQPVKVQDYDFVIAPFDKAGNPTYWLKFSSLSTSRVFATPNNHNTAPPATSKLDYDQAFKKIKRTISETEMNKVILARQIKIDKTEDDPYRLFIDLKNTYRDAFTYLISTPETGSWLGASPELVLSKNKGAIKTTAIAGTQKLEGRVEDISWESKERREHGIIEEYLKQSLEAAEIKYNISETSTVPAGGVCHIHSLIDIAPDTNLKKVIDIIHPGPALSGHPKYKAIQYILDNEPTSRKFYCGFLGPIKDKTIEWYANIRCLQVHSDSYTLYVGGGITSESQLDAEWEETNLKAKTLLSIIETAAVQ